MRLFIASDLHQEFGDYPFTIPEADVIILAGDIGLGTDGIKWAKTLDKPVIFVAGNHEFYSHKFPDLYNDLMAEAESSKVHVLQDKELILNGVRFLGCTLWTDFDLFGNVPIAKLLAQRSLNDFNKIRTGASYQKINPDLISTSCRESKNWLQAKFSEPFNGKTIVVTHHAPSQKSVAEIYQHDQLTPAFASRLDDLVASSGADLWIHGHMHNSSDYYIDKTRMICNPFGYKNYEQNPEFIHNLLVDI